MTKHKNTCVAVALPARGDGDYSSESASPPAPRSAWNHGWDGRPVPVTAPPQSPRQPKLPEILLLEAVLNDALNCVRKTRRGLSRREFLESYEWVRSDRRDGPFSFLNLCDFLTIDASALRKRLGVTDEAAGTVSENRPPWRTREPILPSSETEETDSSTNGNDERDGRSDHGPSAGVSPQW